MKRIVLLGLVALFYHSGNSQTNLLVNGGYESNFASWFAAAPNGNLWAGIGTCTPAVGQRYSWLADQNEALGINNAVEDVFQTVTIPAASSACVLTFQTSINTMESTTGTAYDFMTFNIRSTTGTLLYSSGSLSNLHGAFGIPGCQSWASYYDSLPSSLFGQTVRFSIEYTTDGSLPTIFRLDNVALTSYPTCSYSLSTSSYTCPNSNAAVLTNVSSVTTQSFCSWSAQVISGGSWLSTTSSGTGNGAIDITVAQNTGSARSGSININGYVLTINQPAFVCSYSLSSSSYLCPNANAAVLTSVSSVITQSPCAWSALVTSGGSWLSTSSSGTGNGAINITVAQNTGPARTGTIDVNGNILTINQPAMPCVYSLSTSSYTCPNANAGVLTSVSNVVTQSFCTWSALVTSGGSWLSTTSSGTGNGAIDITVTQNTGPARIGTIDINGTTLTINQPALSCAYSLSSSSYLCPNANAGVLTSVSNVITQSNCTWNAIVTSGASWLSTSSSGTGNGSIDITVTQNTGSARTGTIDVNGQILTINQPAISCTYSLSQNNVILPDHSANTYNSIALVNTQSNCSWTASVTTGNAWLVTSSAGTGAGSLSVVVLENTTGALRTATVDIEGQIITIIQPEKDQPNSIDEYSDESIFIYPNPAVENIMIEVPEALVGQEYIIIDVSGKQVLQGRIEENIQKVDVSYLTSGLFIIRFQQSDKLIKKFYKN